MKASKTNTASALLFLVVVLSPLLLADHGVSFAFAFTTYTPRAATTMNLPIVRTTHTNSYRRCSTIVNQQVESSTLSQSEKPDDGASLAVDLMEVPSSSSSSLSMDMTAIPISSINSKSNGGDALALWKRRLITHEDPWSIHKWSSILYTISSVVILGTAGIRFATDLLLTHDTTFATFNEIPSSLGPWVAIFSISNVIMCLASVRMSFIHRQGDLTARNAFLGTCVSSLFSGFFFLWSSPFAPAVFNVDWVSQGCFAILVLLNAVFIMDTLINIPEVVEGRRERKVEDENSTAIFWRDALGYVLPIAWGLPVIGLTGYLASVVHDRVWFVDYIQQVATLHQIPFVAAVCYLQVMASLAASYGALFVTLRDKKLITKNQELVGITVFSVPAMIWTIYTTVVFCSDLSTFA